MRGAYYNRYNTELSPEERRGLYGFLMDLSMSEGRNAFNDLNDYDMGGAYKASLKERSDKGYFWDLYKKPNHPVFSDDSIYHGVDGHYGGHWTEGTPDIPGGTFIPSEWNLQNMPPEEMKWYFAKYEPEAKLYFPEEGDKGMIHDFRNKSGGGLLDFAMNAAGLVPGMQWLPAAYAGAKAIGSAASGDMGGAVKNGLSAYIGLSGTGGASGGNAPTMTTQMESDPLYISRRLSALNGNDAAGVSANYSPVLRSAGMSPDTSYADAARAADISAQHNYDDKYAALGKMYGLVPGQPGSAGFSQDAAKDYYRTFGAGGRYDTDYDASIFNALQRMFGRGY